MARRGVSPIHLDDGYASKKAKSSSWEPFDGVLTVNDDEFAHFMECMTKPGEPTEGARRGAALLKKLKRFSALIGKK